MRAMPTRMSSSQPPAWSRARGTLDPGPQQAEHYADGADDDAERAQSQGVGGGLAGAGGGGLGIGEALLGLGIQGGARRELQRGGLLDAVEAAGATLELL